jgi:hypothetical protein
LIVLEGCGFGGLGDQCQESFIDGMEASGV